MRRWPPHVPILGNNCPSSISEADTEVSGGCDRIGVERHSARHRQRLFEGERHDAWWLKCQHPPELALREQADRRRPEPERQQPVKGRWSPTALEMAKHQCPSLFPGLLVDRVGHLAADAAQ